MAFGVAALGDSSGLKDAAVARLEAGIRGGEDLAVRELESIAAFRSLPCIVVGLPACSAAAAAALLELSCCGWRPRLLPAMTQAPVERHSVPLASPSLFVYSSYLHHPTLCTPPLLTEAWSLCRACLEQLQALTVGMCGENCGSIFKSGVVDDDVEKKVLSKRTAL